MDGLIVDWGLSRAVDKRVYGNSPTPDGVECMQRLAARLRGQGIVDFDGETDMTSASLKPLPADEFGYWQAHHLLNRAGFGGTPVQVRLLADWGLQKSVDHLVNFEQVPGESVRPTDFDSAIMKPLSPEDRLLYRRAQANQDEALLEKFRMARQDRQRRDRRQIRDVQEWWLTRMIESPRPLEEKMTLFYHGHFATNYRTIENSYHMFLQNQTFRKFAMGNFGDLCFQMIRDPAMIAYLDNNDSRKGAPNENLARELMELFTLGEGNGYTEQDIKQGARALTGYTFNDNKFIFRSDMHDTDQKVIFGKRGNYNGDDFVKLILQHRQCAQYICYKLYRFFVNDLPDGPDATAKAVINGMAGLFRTEKYEVAPVLETLFKSRHFYEEKNFAARIKSPIQLTVGAIRAFETPVNDLGVLMDAMDLMGQSILFPPSVKGWDGGRSWINTSTLFIRQNLVTYLLTGRLPNGFRGSSNRTDFDAMKLLESVPKTDGELPLNESIAFLVRMCLGHDVAKERVESLNTFAQANGGRLNNEMVIGMLCLIAAMPEFQLV